MSITQGQIEFYQNNGYLVFENLFSQKEINVLLDELPAIFLQPSERRILEQNGAVRTVFASHQHSETMQALVRLPQLLEISQILLESDVYVHQFKINAKLALEGEQWEWHQDFLYWNKEDAMPNSRVVTAAIFLQNVDDFNGPMLIIPKSHLEGMVNVAAQNSSNGIDSNNNPAWLSTLTSDLKYKINRDILCNLLKTSEIKPIKGSAGLTVFFHGDLFHASSQNLSGIDRQSIFVSYNSIENKLEEKKEPRPDFIASRNFTPLEPVSKNALLEVTANLAKAK